jgi:hypothetical protein
LIYIHDKNQHPDPTSALHLVPGQFHQIAVSHRTISRLEAPHGNCEEREQPYSVAHCLDACVAKYVVAACGCLPTINHMPQHELHEDNEYCFSTAEHECWVDLGIDEDISNGHPIWRFSEAREPDFECDCPQPCQEETYDVQLSSSQWPAPEFLVFQSLFPEREDADLDDAAESIGVAQSLVAFEVQFQTHNSVNVKQLEALPFVTWLAGVGGFLGLFLGVSVITIMEWLEFIILAFGFCCCRHHVVKAVAGKTASADATPRVQNNTATTSATTTTAAAVASPPDAAATAAVAQDDVQKKDDEVDEKTSDDDEPDERTALTV